MASEQMNKNYQDKMQLPPPAVQGILSAVSTVAILIVHVFSPVLF